MNFLKRTIGWGVALGLGSFVSVVIASAAGLLGSSDQEQSKLAIRIQDLREVQLALATPLSPPDPLPPITAKPAHALSRTIVSSLDSRRDHPRVPALPAAARNAFAAVEPSPATPRWNSNYPSYDRHAVH